MTTMDSRTDVAAPARPTAPAATLLAAFVTVAKRLRQAPLPVDDSVRDVWNGQPPAPRHIAALLHVVADQPLSVSTLAERLGISLATASQVVTDLEERQLVERQDDPTDRRRTLVRTAETHRDLTDALLDTRLRPVQRALDRLDPAAQRGFVRGLQLLAEALENENR